MKHPFTDKEIAEDFFKTMTEEDKKYVRDIPNKDFMSMFHLTVGMHIRNEYHLWQRPKWKPELIDGVDHSPMHPDAISGRILELIWEMCHDEK